MKGTVLVIGALAVAMEKNDAAAVVGRNGERQIGRGPIVSLTLADSHIVEPLKGPYIASKHGALSIVKTAALKNAEKQIRINSLCPWWVDTPMMDVCFTLQPKHPNASTGAIRGSACLFLKKLQTLPYSCSVQAPSGTGLTIDHGVLLSGNTNSLLLALDQDGSVQPRSKPNLLIRHLHCTQ